MLISFVGCKSTKKKRNLQIYDKYLAFKALFYIKYNLF